MSNNRRTGDLLTDAANDAQRNGMMGGLVKRARDAAANALNRSLLFELADRIEELESDLEKQKAVSIKEHDALAYNILKAIKNKALGEASVSELVAEIRRRDNPPMTGVKPRPLMEDQSDE